MNITLLGYGKMGHMIASLTAKDHAIVSTIDLTAPDATHKTINASALKNTDVVIDFSHPEGFLDNLRRIAPFGKNVVAGTTGWYDHLETAKNIVTAGNIGFIYSSNFSIGVQLFLRLVERAGELFNPFEGYDAFAHEFHHRQKADSPSGTALSVAKVLLKTLPRKKTILADTSHGKIAPDALHLTSTRGGHIPGTHEVFFDSEADTVEIRHTARSRAGFAAGALKASQWLLGKKGFFTMDDFLKDLLNS